MYLEKKIQETLEQNVTFKIAMLPVVTKVSPVSDL